MEKLVCVRHNNVVLRVSATEAERYVSNGWVYTVKRRYKRYLKANNR